MKGTVTSMFALQEEAVFSFTLSAFPLQKKYFTTFKQNHNWAFFPHRGQKYLSHTLPFFVFLPVSQGCA